MTTTTQAEYIERELKQAHAWLRAVETASLADRQAARADWSDALLDPKLIGERVRWLMNGSYGYGQCLITRRAFKARGNRVAVIGLYLAAFEWHCPTSFAREAWTKLTPAQQKAANDAIAEALATDDWAVNDE